MLVKPYVRQRTVRTEMAMARPRSLRRMSLASLASKSGLYGLKWLTPVKYPFFFPLPRPSDWRSW
jgi:hypothetical protein